MLYRVRCKDWENLWGEDLSWEEAHKLKELVSGRRLSKTVRVEPMSSPAPDNLPPVKDVGRVVLANAVRPAGVAHDDELDELEDSDDAGDIDRLVDDAIEAEERAEKPKAVGAPVSWPAVAGGTRR